MSIEGSSTVASHKPATGDASRAAKSKGAAGGALDALGGAGGGFSALLNSFDSEVVEDDALAQQMAMDQPAPALQPPADPLLKPLSQDLPNDLQLLLAQANEVSAGKSTALPADVLGTQLSSPLTTEVASTADFAACSMPIPFAQGTLGNQPTPLGLAGKENLALLNRSVIPAAGTMSLVEQPATDVALPADLLLVQPGQGAQQRSLKSRVAEGLTGVGNAMLDPRLQGASVSVDVAARETAMMGALVPGGFSEGLARPGDRSSSKPSFALAGSGAEGLWGQTAFQAAPGPEASSVAAESAASSMESVVADTVSYWVSQGVKNAALKLDGFGEHPLEVNISMQGGEARIDFRTDQPEIRQILEGAMKDLKDLLRSEGVVLSGVSVGSSGQNGAGSQDGRDRPGARQGTVATVKTSPADSPRVVSLPAGRVLDLFV
jgi:flagellar hook-length control protein FliK